MVAHAGFWRVRQIPVVIVLLVAALGLTGCTRGGDHDSVQASMSVSPQAALVDQPVTVSVGGLPAGARTTLTAKATDTDGTTWSATAQFQATSAGELSLSQPSLGGSYTGANPMGLLTLMAPPPGSAPAVFLHPEAGYDVALQVSVSGQVVATATIRRQGPAAVGVVEKQAAASQRWDLRQPVPAQAHRGQAARSAGLRRLRRGPHHQLRGRPAGRPRLPSSFGPDGTVVAVNCYVSNIEACQAIPTIKPGS